MEVEMPGFLQMLYIFEGWISTNWWGRVDDPVVMWFPGKDRCFRTRRDSFMPIVSNTSPCFLAWQGKQRWFGLQTVLSVANDRTNRCKCWCSSSKNFHAAHTCAFGVRMICYMLCNAIEVQGSFTHILGLKTLHFSMGNIGSNGWFLTLLCSSDVLWCLQRIRLDVDVIKSIHFFLRILETFSFHVFLATTRKQLKMTCTVLETTVLNLQRLHSQKRGQEYFCVLAAMFSCCVAPNAGLLILLGKNVGENLDMHVDADFPATRYRCICHPFLLFLLRKKPLPLHHGIISIPSKTPGAEIFEGYRPSIYFILSGG